MTAPTFTCDRCGKQATNRYAATSVIHRALCLDCVHAVRRDIDQFAGQGEPHGVVASSSAPATPSLVEWLRGRAVRLREVDYETALPEDADRMAEAADRIEELEALRATDREAERDGALKEAYRVATMYGEDRPTEWENVESITTDRPVDLASDDRLIPLPGGRIAVAAQDLRVGDVLSGEPVKDVYGGILTHFGYDIDTLWPRGTLVLLDKAAES